MFSHIFKYEFKSCLRQKAILFWLIAFPIILGCFFKMAFSGIYEKDVVFNAIPVAVTNIEENDILKQVLEHISDSDEALFKVTYTDIDKAEEMLKSEDIKGIIKASDLSLEFGSTGIQQTIVKAFIQQYKTQEKIITDTAKNAPQKLDKVIASISEKISPNEDIPLHGNPDITIQFFYNLLAMTALFGSMSGLFVAQENQGDLSALGARRCCSPVNKLTSITATLLAFHVVEMICMVISVTFLRFVLKVDFGSKLPLVYLAAVLGGIMGISMGFFVGSFRIKEGLKMSVVMAVSMTCCFFSGLMSNTMKGTVAEHCPIFNEINPAAIISDSFYCLNLYEDYRRFTVKIISMAIYTVLFTLSGYVLTRRRKYASL